VYAWVLEVSPVMAKFTTTLYMTLMTAIIIWYIGHSSSRSNVGSSKCLSYDCFISTLYQLHFASWAARNTA